jgi:uncharacterized protein with ParB-like and HNH nuclease domain
MKPSIQTLGQILYSPSQYVIPIFQRNYRWARPQWAKLWESLLEFRSSEKSGNHFMGFLVFVPGLAQPGQNTTFHLIDGQQRLTTSSLLLVAIRNVARSLAQTELADEIHQDYLVHPRKKDEHHFRLLPKERDHDSYLSIVMLKGEPTGRTADALAYFEEQLTSLIKGKPELLRSVFDIVRQRLEFMCATLEKENAYNIFKSLNSTGVPLGPSDLIRNFMFMNVPPEEQDEFDQDVWGPLENRFSNDDGSLAEDRFSRFFRDYLMSNGKYVAPKDTFPSFESRYEATDFAPKEVAQTILNAAQCYSVICGDENDESTDVTKALSGLNVLESSTTYPLLLALFQRRTEGVITSSQLAQAVEMLRGFILRRFVCNESSRGYGQMFVRALAIDKGDPLEAIEAYLLERGWPDDRQFESAFVEFPLYLRGYTREVLETLERSRGHKEPADLRAAEVEHVLPQTLSKAWVKELGPNAESIHADWLHRPGNLTLSAYNKELWNHPFKKKSERYAESNIVLTRELADYEQWTDTEIRERGKLLANEATKIWIGPKEQIVRPEQEAVEDDEGPGRRELRQQFWDALNDYFVAELPELPKFETRPSWIIRLPSGVRHIGITLRFSLRHLYVGIDVWFWREASLPIWQRISVSPDKFNELLKTKWEFEQVEGHSRARMFISLSVPELRTESSWLDAHRWFGEKLSLVYESVIPELRDEMDSRDKAA